MESIYVQNAPKAVGPYCHAKKVDNLLFLSGQLGVNPTTNQLITTGLVDECTQVLENIKTVLSACDTNLQNIIKTTIFLVRIEDFSQINQVYGKYFTENPPARSCFAVKALPLGGQVEIECIAKI